MGELSTTNKALVAIISLAASISFAMLVFIAIRWRLRVRRSKDHNRIRMIEKGARNDDQSAIPEIRIQFPDELSNPDDPNSNITKGKLCVVCVGESGAAYVTPLTGTSSQSPLLATGIESEYEQMDIEGLGGLKIRLEPSNTSLEETHASIFKTLKSKLYRH